MLYTTYYTQEYFLEIKFQGQSKTETKSPAILHLGSVYPAWRLMTPFLSERNQN